MEIILMEMEIKCLQVFRKFGYTGKLGFAPAKNHKVILTYSEFYARDVNVSILSNGRAR